MLRYYFHVYDDDNSSDDEGVEFVNMRAAGVEAFRFAGDLIKAKAAQMLSGELWHMEVKDQQGLVIIRLDLKLSGFLLDASAS
ncbi:hypothetical protein MKK68_08155 [Methylobacterium sp. E-016]|uniref:DUF6894 family protein n=1 Tax=Methylobacterium sp. E-016 TaxID=2836556 RepID=UPI001FB99F3A|nr:hypothetical protein [Methylobacterium sp. E-016]MCJ2075625.1 hypothetical protein [Methylobacterium sp. E-016]